MEKLKLSQLYIFLFLMLTLSGCEVIGDIFEAGVWVGIIVVVAVVMLVIWLIRAIL